MKDGAIDRANNQLPCPLGWGIKVKHESGGGLQPFYFKRGGLYVNTQDQVDMTLEIIFSYS
ncbi:MAG: hypothetical protein ACKVOQ_19840 [Cyclobacteriaceae bacterium]